MGCVLRAAPPTLLPVTCEKHPHNLAEAPRNVCPRARGGDVCMCCDPRAPATQEVRGSDPRTPRTHSIGIPYRFACSHSRLVVSDHMQNSECGIEIPYHSACSHSVSSWVAGALGSQHAFWALRWIRLDNSATLRCCTPPSIYSMQKRVSCAVLYARSGRRWRANE